MRLYSFSIIFLFFFISCKGSPQKSGTTIVLKFTFSTWDNESGIILGSDSLKIRNEIKSSNDILENKTFLISQKALNEIGAFVYDNSKDSIIQSKVNGHKYLLTSRLVMNNDTLKYCIQKGKQKDYLESLINLLKSSENRDEFLEIVKRLELYNKIDKHGH